MKNYILAVTFVENYHRYNIVSANIGDIINGKFILIKSLKVNNKLLTYCFPKKDLNEVQNYLNTTWNNKGLMLLDVRSEKPIISALSKILINAHEAVNNNISSIICGVASNKEFEAYKKSINHIEENNLIEEKFDG